MYEYKICKEIESFNDLYNLDDLLVCIADEFKIKAFTYFIGKGYWSNGYHCLLRIEFSKKDNLECLDDFLNALNRNFDGATASYHINFGNQCIAGKSKKND